MNGACGKDIPQWLNKIAALPEDQSLVCNTYFGQLTTV